MAGGGSAAGGEPPIGVVVLTSGVGAMGVEVLDFPPQAASQIANSTTVAEHAKSRLGMKLGGTRRPK
jgi:hypothetical protein